MLIVATIRLSTSVVASGYLREKVQKASSSWISLLRPGLMCTCANVVAVSEILPDPPCAHNSVVRHAFRPQTVQSILGSPLNIYDIA